MVLPTVLALGGHPKVDDEYRQLNVIELLWKYLRRKVAHNHLFESVAALTTAVETFFTELDRQPATVLSVIGCSA